MSATNSDTRKFAVVIPALNEQTSIGEIVRKVTALASAIVVDDGSQDATAEVARSAGAEVISHKFNRGYDHALESGMQRALALGYDAAITMDADGQHDPETLSAFIVELRRGVDVVIGIRDRKQRFSESLFSWVGKILWGIDDPLCGMKGYRMALLLKAGHFDTYGSIGTELAIRAARSGCRIAQVAMKTRKRAGTPRFGGGLRPNYRILRGLILGFFYASRLPSKNQCSQNTLPR